MLAGDEVSDGPPKSFVDGDNGRALHQVLNWWNRFGIAGMKIEITVSNAERCSAAGAHQAAWAAERMFRMI